MEEGRVFFDASAYFLFEASGDSEAQYPGGASMELESDAPADDDAQSCSDGSVSDSGGVRHVDDRGADNIRGADFDYWSREEEDYGGGGAEEEEDGVVDQCCRRDSTTAEALEKSKISMNCEDSNAKTMNEREADRSFWEACLAS